MKQLLAVIILCALACVPVAGQVPIYRAEEPSEVALDIEERWDSARALLEYLLSTSTEDSCVGAEGSALFLTPFVYVCVFADPIDSRWILLATVEDGKYTAETILLLKDTEFYAVAAEPDSSNQTALILHDLPVGLYEIVFILGTGDDTERIVFYFWIEDPQGDD